MYIIPLCSLKVNTYRKKARRSGKNYRDRLAFLRSNHNLSAAMNIDPSKYSLFPESDG